MFVSKNQKHYCQVLTVPQWKYAYLEQHFADKTGRPNVHLVYRQMIGSLYPLYI